MTLIEPNAGTTQSGAFEDNVHTARTSYLIKASKQSLVFGLIVAALVTGLILVSGNGSPWPAIWLSFLGLMTVIRYYHITAAGRSGQPWIRKERVVFAHTLIVGLFWFAAPFVFALPFDSMALTTFTIAMAAIALGGAVPYSVSPKTALVFLIPTIGGIATYHVRLGGTESLFLAAMMVMFGLFTLGMVRQMRRQILSQIRTAKSLEHQIKQTERADAASEAKSRFLATMSHEIRTPMNGVLGFANILSESQLDDHQTYCVNTIQKSGGALMSILNDILDVSKIEAGAMELESAPFDLLGVVEDCVELFDAQARSKAIDFATYVDPAIPRSLIGDGDRLSQVLTNLVNNAIKFTSVGTIGVSVRSLGETEAGHSILLEVKDSGIGIEEQQLKNIFDRFAQADSSTTRKYGGTGLGLAICQQITHLMGGEIFVESQVGAGSTFQISLDLSTTFPPALPISASFETDALAGKHALIVDDTQINLDYFRMQLSAYGMTCETALSAQAALDILQAPNAKFDVAIVDHLMPDMDGFGFARALQQTGSQTGLGLILSSSADLSTQSHAQSQGFHAVVPKPIRQTVLIAALNSVMDRASAKPAPISSGLDVDDLDSILDELSPVSAAPLQPAKVAPIRDIVNPALAPKIRILVAEDNPVNSQLLRIKLTMLNYSVDIVGDGAEAVQAVQNRPYDIVLMDVRMPVIDGVEATRNIRACGQSWANLPIIALTADVMDGGGAAFINAGMDAFISKPINFDMLMARIQTLTDAARPVMPRSGNA